MRVEGIASLLSRPITSVHTQLEETTSVPLGQGPLVCVSN
jgi:hypothetical protein